MPEKSACPHQFCNFHAVLGILLKLSPTSLPYLQNPVNTLGFIDKAKNEVIWVIMLEYMQLYIKSNLNINI